MAKPFSVNTYRFDPYKAYNFLVYFEQSTTPVAAVSKMTGLKRTTEMAEYKAGGEPISRKGMLRTSYADITLERGVTHDKDFETWANAAQVLDKGHASQSPKNLRRELRIDLLNEGGQAVIRYFIHHAWVSEYQALPDLDAGANAYAIESIKLVNEGWERDLSLTEPQEL